MRIINFAPPNAPTNKLYQDSKILKFADYVKLKNFLLVHGSLHNNLLVALQYSFTPVAENHSYNTRGSSNMKMALQKINNVNSG